MSENDLSPLQQANEVLTAKVMELQNLVYQLREESDYQRERANLVGKLLQIAVSDYSELKHHLKDIATKQRERCALEVCPAPDVCPSPSCEAKTIRKTPLVTDIL